MTGDIPGVGEHDLKDLLRTDSVPADWEEY
jgi:hypothetical protein